MKEVPQCSMCERESTVYVRNDTKGVETTFCELHYGFWLATDQGESSGQFSSWFRSHSSDLMDIAKQNGYPSSPE